MTAYRLPSRHGIALAILVAASSAGAQETVVSLTPEAREQALDAAADRNVNRIGEPAINGLSRQVHGEVGMFVGTHGSRGVFGSAVMPVGENGQAAVAFENSRFGR